MGRYLLGGKEAHLPFEIEELDIRIYTVEELCYYIYHNLPLIDDRFIDERLLSFLRKELGISAIADKIDKFYQSASDQDATLLMLLSEVGYYTESELTEFQTMLTKRRRLNAVERVLLKADWLYKNERYQKAIHYYRTLMKDTSDIRITKEMRMRIIESIANSYGHLYAFDRAALYYETAYDEFREEKYLKKLYEISLLSGIELPSRYFDAVPETLLASYLTEYREKESIYRDRITEEPIMKTFFKSKKETESDIKKYIEERRKKYRRSME